jgi:arginine decarboxylase
LKALRAFVEEIRYKNADIPLYLYGETRTSRHIPNDILRELHGFIHMFEDTPEFVARHIIREAKAYLDGLSPPFFARWCITRKMVRTLGTALAIQVV